MITSTTHQTNQLSYTAKKLNTLWLEFTSLPTSQNRDPKLKTILNKILKYDPQYLSYFLAIKIAENPDKKDNYQNYFLNFYSRATYWPEKYDQILNLISGNNLLLGTFFILAAKNNNNILLSKMEKFINQNDFGEAINFYTKHANRIQIHKDDDPHQFYDSPEGFFLTILKNPGIRHTFEKFNQKSHITPNNANLYWGCADSGAPDSIVNIVNDFSFSPIKPPLYRIFKKAGFNLNSQNRFGNTPAQIMLVQLIQEKDSMILVQLLELIRAGADLDIKNSQGNTFIDSWRSPLFQKIINKIKQKNQTWFEEKDQYQEFSDFILDSTTSINAIEAHLEKHNITKALPNKKDIKNKNYPNLKTKI